MQTAPSGTGGSPPMVEGVYYDLIPPAEIKGEKFHRVLCEFQVPKDPDQFVVKGIPEGGDQEKSFVLVFGPKGRVKQVRPSEDQN